MSRCPAQDFHRGRGRSIPELNMVMGSRVVLRPAHWGWFRGSPGAEKSCHGRGPPRGFFVNTTPKGHFSATAGSRSLNVDMDPEKQHQREGRKKHRK